MNNNSSQDLLSRLSHIKNQLSDYESVIRDLIADCKTESEILNLPLPADYEGRVSAYDIYQRGGHIMYPPATEKEVIEFETRHGIELPIDYREFILTIGNGGEGPPYCDGMLPLQEQADSELNKPFPFTKQWVWEGVFSEELLEKIWKKKYYGNIYLGTDGCGMDWILIVYGAEKGKIWQFTDVGIRPCAPSLSFLDWYEYWLDGRDDWWREASNEIDDYHLEDDDVFLID